MKQFNNSFALLAAIILFIGLLGTETRATSMTRNFARYSMGIEPQQHKASRAVESLNQPPQPQPRVRRQLPNMPAPPSPPQMPMPGGRK